MVQPKEGLLGLAFDGVKRKTVSPVAANIEVPVIKNKGSQIISMTQNDIQVMKMQAF